MKKVIFLNKRQLMKLNRKERQDYLETEKRYNKFQTALMTGMIKHVENSHEFNKVGHKLDEDYLIETYEKIINANYSKIKKEEKKIASEERITESKPSEGSLTGNIARLKKLYKSGTLTKAEFEKAKNKLLK